MAASLQAELAALFEGKATRRYGLEDVSQLEHALQAALQAERGGEPPAMILAALLHDVGHMIHAYGENPAAEGKDDRHELLGGKWLATRLPGSVSEPVRLHVAAKRYLCATEPGYTDKLAPDSVRSLKLQGGPMSADEAAQFRDDPYAEEAIRLRRYDDAAKAPEMRTPKVGHFLNYLPAAAIGRSERSEFARNGVVVLRDLLRPEEAARLAGLSAEMGEQAEALLAEASRRGRSPAQLAREKKGSLIVVPEAGHPKKVCRFEYLQGANAEFRRFVAERIAPLVSGLAGEAFVPFKDKENEKHPGGGAFGPHQDFAAYQAFGPRYNITAMLTIDPATRENGCLEFAEGAPAFARRNPSSVAATIEGRPLFRFREGGLRHGDILDAIECGLRWNSVETGPRDVVLFDSFVPHRSAPNESLASRRAMFLTFNAAREGEWYDRYYADKRMNFDDPKFHVSTPTSHG